MEAKHIISGVILGVIIFGAYFLGIFHEERSRISWREIVRDLTRALTWRGFAWSLLLPLSWILLFYGFIAHVWLSLGRWPRFGEQLQGRVLLFHQEVSTYLFGTLVASLFVVPVAILLCLCVRRFRHVSVYALCYGTAVGLAAAALFLAPGPFLNWLFD